MRKITGIIIHCSATKPDWMAGASADAKRDEIRRWHVEGNGWSDIGYHYLIDRNGTIVEGRPIERDGAHVKGHNKGTIGICLLGGHGSSENDAFADNFTEAQDLALRGLIDLMQKAYGKVPVTGHNEYAAKACPGFRVSRWLAKKTPTRTAAAQSTTVQASFAQIGTAAGAGASAIAALDGTAQIIALAFAGAVALLAIWIMRERLKKWAEGVR